MDQGEGFADADAALVGGDAVDTPNILDAARLVLPHRMQAGPLESPEGMEARLTELIHRVVSAGPVSEPTGDEEGAAAEDEALDQSLASMQIPGSMAAGSIPGPDSAVLNRGIPPMAW